MKTFLQEKKVTKRGADSNVSLRELSKMMKRIPQYQKELSKVLNKEKGVASCNAYLVNSINCTCTWLNLAGKSTRIRLTSCAKWNR